jgi:hypothetical protein
MLAAFGALAQAEERDGMALLKEAQALMNDLAANRLPLGDCGEGVQKDQKRIISDFDALIRMILDNEAEQKSGKPDSSSSPSDPQTGNPKPSNPDNSKHDGQDIGKVDKFGQPIPATKPGGQPRGTRGPDGGLSTDPNSWTVLPAAKEYNDTGMGASTVTVPGYEKLLERFRRTIAREGVRIPK